MLMCSHALLERDIVSPEDDAPQNNLMTITFSNNNLMKNTQPNINLMKYCRLIHRVSVSKIRTEVGPIYWSNDLVEISFYNN